MEAMKKRLEQISIPAASMAEGMGESPSAHATAASKGEEEVEQRMEDANVLEVEPIIAEIPAPDPDPSVDPNEAPTSAPDGVQAPIAPEVPIDVALETQTPTASEMVPLKSRVKYR